MELMKNGLAKPAVKRIAFALSQVNNDFNSAQFIKEAMEDIEALELKERVNHLITILHQHLPSDFTKAARQLKKIPTVWNYGSPDDALRGFAAWPIIDYVGVYGLQYPEVAMATLKKLTPLFSAEFAIRPLLLTHPDYCQKLLTQWMEDKDEHVRRLVSEGTRPRLPWGMQLKPRIKDPSPNLPLLNHLKNDCSLYVRRSVANHLNDIAKDHPNKVIEICSEWYPKANEEVKWVIKHATRTLVKAGHPEVFSLLGYTKKLSVTKPTLKLENTNIQLGESLRFELTLQSTAKRQQKMVVDFAIHFIKANGQQKAKVFKLKSLELAANESVTLTKNHPIKAITTRKYYAGLHKIEILLNGKPVAASDFELSITA
ncbi:MAG: 3-methyladenine DNA glycosylase AlkC [Pseudohongiellaceae bacterium]|jgi:3-methyladenine DNA glycosylase AlkC